ncbi:aldehyde dehydrogenase family protein [Glutamicibacter halophytocola]|uniref:aldehyde dehydrogenase family protein n=1 Tax=Glutamicibacter halophytocola TaxID=1933880 RepID=UPI00321A6475
MAEDTSAQQIENYLAAADEAFAGWSQTPAAGRADVLDIVADALDAGRRAADTRGNERDQPA